MSSKLQSMLRLAVASNVPNAFRRALHSIFLGVILSLSLILTASLLDVERMLTRLYNVEIIRWQDGCVSMERMRSLLGTQTYIRPIDLLTDEIDSTELGALPAFALHHLAKMDNPTNGPRGKGLIVDERGWAYPCFAE